ncbi:MAG: transposase, partial [Prevotella conceptionensis]
KGYHGAIQSDGYEAYGRFENVQGIELLGCMAHVRRKFEHLAAKRTTFCCKSPKNWCKWQFLEINIHFVVCTS